MCGSYQLDTLIKNLPDGCVAGHAEVMRTGFCCLKTDSKTISTIDITEVSVMYKPIAGL